MSMQVYAPAWTRSWLGWFLIDSTKFFPSVWLRQVRTKNYLFSIVASFQRSFTIINDVVGWGFVSSFSFNRVYLIWKRANNSNMFLGTFTKCSVANSQTSNRGYISQSVFSWALTVSFQQNNLFLLTKYKSTPINIWNMNVLD